jgi:hypothetical protein
MEQGKQVPEEKPAVPDWEEDAESAPPIPHEKRSGWLVGGLALLVVVLAAAAYLGAQQLMPGADAASSQGGRRASAPGVLRGGPYLGPGGQFYKLPLRFAPELPKEQPLIVGGSLIRQQDNSIFVGTGRGSFEVSATPGRAGQPPVRTVHVLSDGPVVEVVITHNTKIYRDITELNSAPVTGKDGLAAPVQQVVRTGTQAEMSSNSVVDVWGERQGDRIVASVLDYTSY